MLYFNTGSNALYYCNGTSWILDGSGSGPTGSQYQVATFTGTNTAAGNADILTNASNDFIVSSGNLAIGTTTVTNAINIKGSTAQTIGMVSGASTGSNLTLRAGGGLIGGTNETGGNLVLASGVSTGTGTSGISFNVYGAGSTGSTANAATTAMTVASTGYVGIGTAGPLAVLDVFKVEGSPGAPLTSGTATNALARVHNGSTNAVMDIGGMGGSPYSGWIQETDVTNLGTTYPLALNPNGGNVGIGTTTPSEAALQQGCSTLYTTDRRG